MFVCVVLDVDLSPVVEICYMLNVCVCCPVISLPSSRDLLYVECLCVVLLSLYSSRNLLYVKCCVCVVPLSHMPNVV